MSDPNFDRKMASNGFRFKAVPSRSGQQPLYFKNENEFRDVTKGLNMSFQLETIAGLEPVAITSSVRDFPLEVLV